VPEEAEAEPEVVALEDEAPIEEPVAEEAPAEEPAAQEVSAPEEAPAAEPVEEEPVVEEPAAEEAPAEETAAEETPAAEGEESAEPAADAAPPAIPSVKPKKKRLPRSERRRRTKPTRERPATRAPIVRLPKPEHARGQRKERRGVVVSSAMDKTIVVRVDTLKPHPVYKKIVRHSRKFHAHDETNVAKAGDVVRIVETRPISKTKSWRLAEVLEEAK
jgi:small subunit ribosomal protein S17